MSDSGMPSIQFTGELHVKLRDAQRAPVASLAMSRQTRLEQLARASGLDLVGRFVEEFEQPVGMLSVRTPSDDMGRWFSLKYRESGLVGALSSPDVSERVWASVRELLSQPEVEYAEPDAILTHPIPETLIQPSGNSPASLRVPLDLWHLDSIGARSAWDFIATAGKAPGEGVLIAHLDTGYTNHPAVPHERFVSPGVDLWDRERRDASDPLEGGLTLAPGHGTGTLCLLAADYRDYQGVARASRILPLRISPSVIHIGTKSMAYGILHAVNKGADVITISMGGLPSRLWADAVNAAYERGVVICAAAGNNFPLPLGGRTPWRVVYPARFSRVLAVSGITRNERPYWSDQEMSGNHGPEVDICAPTPDVPWARPGGGYSLGAGTSTATPQVAGAAALWLSYYREQLAGFSPVERVEACRRALLMGARDAGPKAYASVDGGRRTHNEYFGDGRLDIARSLREFPPVAGLPAQPKDDVSWALLRVLGFASAAATRGVELADAIEMLWTSQTVDVEGVAREALASKVSVSLHGRLESPLESGTQTPSLTLGPRTEPEPRLASNKLLVIPPPMAQASVVTSMGLAPTFNAAPVSRSHREALQVRAGYLEAFGRLALAGASMRAHTMMVRDAQSVRSFAATASASSVDEAMTSEERPPFEVLEGVGVLLVDGDKVDRVAVEAMGARVYEDVIVPCVEPVPTKKSGGEGGGGGGRNRWHLERLGLIDDQGHRLVAQQGAGVLIGVLDTGVDANHSEFRGRKHHFAHVNAWGGVTPRPPHDADTVHGHGTHVCGLIAGETTGVAPEATLAVACVLNQPDPKTGAMGGGRVQIARGLNWLLTEDFREQEGDAGVDVLNLSLGVYGYDDFLYDTLLLAREGGTLAVCASGNWGKRGVNHHGSPGNYDIAVGVGAIDSRGDVASFSDWGTVAEHKYLQKPDLCAPGVQVWSSLPNEAYGPMDGTSMASPLVAGIAALLIEAQPELRLDAQALTKMLYSLVTPLPTANAGRGAIRLKPGQTLQSSGTDPIG